MRGPAGEGAGNGGHVLEVVVAARASTRGREWDHRAAGRVAGSVKIVQRSAGIPVNAVW
jgi:hypothetical protein